MMLQRWDPFKELHRMEVTMDRLSRGFGLGPRLNGGHVERWAVPLDVVEEKDEILVRATVPGINPDDLEVQIEEGVLTIRGQTREEHEAKDGNYLLHERRTGTFYRALRLPDTVDTDKAQPRYENGVLTIALPKLETKKTRQLKIEVGKAIQGEKK